MRTASGLIDATKMPCARITSQDLWKNRRGQILKRITRIYAGAMRFTVRKLMNKIRKGAHE